MKLAQLQEARHARADEYEIFHVSHFYDSLPSTPYVDTSTGVLVLDKGEESEVLDDGKHYPSIDVSWVDVAARDEAYMQAFVQSLEPEDIEMDLDEMWDYGPYHRKGYSQEAVSAIASQAKKF